MNKKLRVLLDALVVLFSQIFFMCVIPIGNNKPISLVSFFTNRNIILFWLVYLIVVILIEIIIKKFKHND